MIFRLGKTKNMRKKIYIVPLLLVALLFWLQSASGQCMPKKSNRLVNDYVGVLSDSQKNTLERKLVDFDNSTSTQILIVIVSDLCDYDKAGFADRIGEEWRVGRKEKDNGLVVLVKPTGGQGERKTHISVGYGLEGVIPDLTAKRIVENDLLPNFKNNNFYEGLDKATSTLISLSSGEFSAADYNQAHTSSRFGYIIPFVIMILIYFLIRVSRVRSYSVGKSIPFWTAFWLMSSMSGRGHGGSWNNFSSGGGSSFGGFGGGSFGGGGAGGSFGGGGAGGSW